MDGEQTYRSPTFWNKSVDIWCDRSLWLLFAITFFVKKLVYHTKLSFLIEGVLLHLGLFSGLCY